MFVVVVLAAKWWKSKMVKLHGGSGSCCESGGGVNVDHNASMIMRDVTNGGHAHTMLNHKTMMHG